MGCRQCYCQNNSTHSLRNRECVYVSLHFKWIPTMMSGLFNCRRPAYFVLIQVQSLSCHIFLSASWAHAVNKKETNNSKIITQQTQRCWTEHYELCVRVCVWVFFFKQNQNIPLWKKGERKQNKYKKQLIWWICSEKRIGNVFLVVFFFDSK